MRPLPKMGVTRLQKRPLQRSNARVGRCTRTLTAVRMTTKMRQARKFMFTRNHSPASLLIWVTVAFAAGADDTKPVSFYHDVVPILKRSCTGCHHPDKLKGELDLTTYVAFQKGGKHGPAFKPGKADDSRVIEEVSGEEPNMPKEGDPLTKEEVALFERWIREGAKDDTPPEANSFKLSEPPVYTALPAISAIEFSPDGNVLAVSGYHEVVLHKPDGSGLVARLVGESPRIESLAFSPDRKLLAVSGGAPSRFGEIQIWNMETHKETQSFKVANDSVYGGDLGVPRIYRISDNQSRTAANNDVNLVREFERQPGPVCSLAYSSDGSLIAVGNVNGEVRIYKTSDGSRIATLKENQGAVF